MVWFSRYLFVAAGSDLNRSLLNLKLLKQFLI